MEEFEKRNADYLLKKEEKLNRIKKELEQDYTFQPKKIARKRSQDAKEMNEVNKLNFDGMEKRHNLESIKEKPRDPPPIPENTPNIGDRLYEQG